MKKTVATVVAVLLCVCFVLSGCTGSYDKRPDQYKKIRWVSSDYSFRIYPEDGCTGMYKFNNKKYNIKVKFDKDTLTVYDTDNKNTELFNADWMYKDKNLYIYGILFNTKKYKDLKTNYSEYVTLHTEKLK